ncbi:MAG: aminotransferase class I/II-fold pyridoxal phosphate-dependent enzyme [Vicinamibacterales bacterium]
MPTSRMRLTGSTATEIAASFESRLHSGGAAPGDGLPTVRELARTLGVSPATVAAAYRQLRARGLTTGSGRRGTRVAPRPPVPAAAGGPRVPDGTVDLASGNPDPALLPPLEPAIKALHADAVLYDSVPADKGFLTFAAAEFEADGIPSRATAVVSGALDAIERILREYLRAGDPVAVEDPSFPGVIDLVRASGFVPSPLALDEHGPRPDAVAEALGKGCRAIVITPRAQNPTGSVIGEDRAAGLRRMLRRFPDVVLIENDHAAPIAGAPIFPLRTDPRARWAVIRSTSKFLGPDLRVAVMAGDELTVSRVRGRQALGTRWVSHILQQLALALWSDPASGRRLARAAEMYTQRRQALRAALASRGIEVHALSGFNVWVPVRDEGRVVSALADRKWAVMAGERFRIRSGPAIRVTASTLDPSDAGRFAADLAEALRPSRSTLA